MTVKKINENVIKQLLTFAQTNGIAMVILILLGVWGVPRIDNMITFIITSQYQHELRLKRSEESVVKFEAQNAEKLKMMHRMIEKITDQEKQSQAIKEYFSLMCGEIKREIRALK